MGSTENDRGIPTRKPTLLQKLAVLYYCLSFGYFTWIWVATILLCARFPILFLPVTVYTIFILSERGTRPMRTASWPTPFKKWSLWYLVRDYFPVRIVKTADLPSGPYIFATFPHGMLCFGGFLTFNSDALGFEKLFPGIDVRTLTLTLNFKAPFLREYLLLLGVCDVSRSSCLSILSRGQSVCIAVGGATESLHAKRRTHRIVLRRRRGFVKIALQTGAALVPVYSFGETDTYYTINEKPPSSKVRRLLERWQRIFVKRLSFAMPLAYGKGVFLPWGLLPLPVPIHAVIGDPIPVPKYEGDLDSAEFHALVDKYHSLYVDTLKKLFDDHKEKYADKDAVLEIVE